MDIATLFAAFLAAHGIVLVVGVLASALVVFACSRIKGKADQVALVLKVMASIEGIIKDFIPGKWQPICDAIISVGSDIANGSFTHEEATAEAIKMFDAGMVAAGVSLSPIETSVTHRAIEMLVDVVCKDKPAAIQAIATKDTPAAARFLKRF